MLLTVSCLKGLDVQLGETPKGGSQSPRRDLLLLLILLLRLLLLLIFRLLRLLRRLLMLLSFRL